MTIVFVTHDQDEALTMSNRVAVIAEGRIQQISSPLELYERPANRFVASFVGEANMLSGVVQSIGSGVAVVVLASGDTVKATLVDPCRIGDAVTISIPT